MAHIGILDQRATRTAGSVRLLRGKPHYKNEFNTSRADLVGASTDSGSGLSLGTWEGVSNSLAVTGGALVRGSSTSTWFNGLPVPEGANGYEVDIEILASPTGSAQFYLVMAQQTLTLVGSPDVLRLAIYPSGNVILSKRIGGVSTNLSDPIAVGINKVVTLRFMGGLASVHVNGVVMATADASEVPLRGYVGLSGVADNAGFRIGSFDTRLM